MLLCPEFEARTAFKDRLSSVRDFVSPPGGTKLDNLGLMTALLDLTEASRPRTGAHSSVSVVPTGDFRPAQVYASIKML